MSIIYKYLLTSFLIVILACDNNEYHESGNAVLRNLAHGDCNTVSKSNDLTEELLHLNADGNFLNINHVNVMYNCCLSEGIGAEMKIINDTIQIEEFEVEPGICDCICPYDVSYDIGPLNEQQYVLCYKRQNGEKYFCYEFVFAPNFEVAVPLNAD